MTLLEVREYFRRFTCGVLTSSEKNKIEIESFISTRNINLERYLKQDAWNHDSDGSTRVYLIRDPNGQIVLFFSLKCGAVFTTPILDDKYQELKPVEKEFVQMIVDARMKNDQELFYQYMDLGPKIFSNFDLISKIQEHRYASKKESQETGDSNYVLKVDKCYAAIELQHFCKHKDYKLPSEIKFPLGFGLFWEKIVPLIEEIISKVGCEYLFLFAADRSENADEKRLISYYKEALCFFALDDEGVVALKPEYDDNCVGLLQRTQYLSNTRESAWEAFSDHVST